MPSVDKVGRYFPLTIASSLGDHAKPFQILENATDWYDAAESLALNVLHEDRVDPDALASSVNALDDSALSGAEHEESVVTGSEWGLCLGVPSGAAMSPAVCHELVQFQVGPYSAWWSPGSDDADAMGLVSPELPAPQCFAYLLRHSWDGSATAETGGELSPNEITDDAS